jgi:predicted metalloprotease
MRGKLLSIVLAVSVSVSFAEASWVVVNDDGSTGRLNSCCSKKVKKVVKAPEFCETCDYSKFPMAKLEPIGKEKLQKATLRNCGK